jgi:hypothetical protein
MNGAVDSVVSGLPERVRHRIARAGLTGQDLQAVLGWPASDGLIFAGSLADGTGRHESDLDFVVLHEGEGRFADLIADRGFEPAEVTRSSFVDRLLTVVGGIEFDIWVVDREQAAPLRQVLASSVTPQGELLSLPGLQYLEMKLLTRLYNPTVLQLPATVEAWRQALRVSALPVIKIAGGLVGCLSYLEDAWSIGNLAEADVVAGADGGADGAGPGGAGVADPFGTVIAARGAAEQLVQSALASTGVLTWDLRYARAHRDRLAAAGAELPVPLRDLESLLLPAAGIDADGYARQVMGCLESYVTGLSSPPELAALDYIRTFAAERFALNLPFL